MTLSARDTQSVRGGVEFDPRIHDSAFLEEIDLYSELMIVAAASAGTLSADAIDRALGLGDVVAAPDDHVRLTIVAGESKR
jgi:hypothetical protein